jgi:hypothetical protein
MGFLLRRGVIVAGGERALAISIAQFAAHS